MKHQPEKSTEIVKPSLSCRSLYIALIVSLLQSPPASRSYVAAWTPRGCSTFAMILTCSRKLEAADHMSANWHYISTQNIIIVPDLGVTPKSRKVLTYWHIKLHSHSRGGLNGLEDPTSVRMTEDNYLMLMKINQSLLQVIPGVDQNRNHRQRARSTKSQWPPEIPILPCELDWWWRSATCEIGLQQEAWITAHVGSPSDLATEVGVWCRGGFIERDSRCPVVCTSIS